MTHEHYMRFAIEQALKGEGQTYTNPLVGAVIVKNNVIVSTGYHSAYGCAHAEVEAINRLSRPEEAIQATLYVTLEPCAHSGKTPPCVDLVIASGINRVVIGHRDPNPLVAGRGIAQLQAAGIEVIEGVLQVDIRRLNQRYHYYHETKRPYLTLKYTSSLDGKIAAARGERTQLSDEQTWQDVQQERATHQAILIGSQTALVDNPLLTIRTLQQRQPLVRIILDRSGRLTNDLILLNDETQPTWIFTEASSWQQRCTQRHVKLFWAEKWSLDEILQVIAAEGIQSVLVEGGAQIVKAFLSGAHYQQVISYVTPYLIGSTGVDVVGGALQQRVHLKLQSMTQLGTAIKLHWLPYSEED